MAKRSLTSQVVSKCGGREVNSVGRTGVWRLLATEQGGCRNRSDSSEEKGGRERTHFVDVESGRVGG